jgi:ABC-type Mn2+/Zn2+ transport system ATPase subunit
MGSRISLQGAFLGYEGRPMLHNLNVDIPLRRLTMVVGSVSTGKSTLLHGLLGEVDLLSGTLSKPDLRVAYCSQDAALFSGSIRSSILFATPYDPERYHRALSAAALDADLALFHDGNRHPVSNLSGGQKHRVGIARALYTDADLVLLDDVFSAVDRETEAHVFGALFDQPGGMLIGKTCILVTNAVRHLAAADYIVHLGDGTVIEQGPPGELAGCGGPTDALIATGTEEVVRQKVDSSAPAVPRALQTAHATMDSVDDEARETRIGGVWSSYVAHARAAGRPFAILVIVLCPICNVSYYASFLLAVRAWTTGTPSEVNSRLAAWSAGFSALTAAYLAISASVCVSLAESPGLRGFHEIQLLP